MAALPPRRAMKRGPKVAGSMRTTSDQAFHRPLHDQEAGSFSVKRFNPAAAWVSRASVPSGAISGPERMSRLGLQVQSSTRSGRGPILPGYGPKATMMALVQRSGKRASLHQPRPRSQRLLAVELRRARRGCTHTHRDGSRERTRLPTYGADGLQLLCGRSESADAATGKKINMDHGANDHVPERHKSRRCHCLCRGATFFRRAEHNGYIPAAGQPACRAERPQQG
jgi:hypothetical protein